MHESSLLLFLLTPFFSLYSSSSFPNFSLNILSDYLLPIRISTDIKRKHSVHYTVAASITHIEKQLKKEGISNESYQESNMEKQLSYQASNMEEQLSSEGRSLTASEPHTPSKSRTHSFLKASLAIGIIGMLLVQCVDYS